ncbi:MAG: PaaI family thioesterase [Dehalococcoidia bacterium]|jgi:acyl-CoA thioesterase
MAKSFPLNKPGFNPFCDLIGLNFATVQDGVSKCSIEVTKQLLNPHGVVHGGVLYSMADTGMGAALYSCIDSEEICATVQLDIRYFQAVSSGTIYCTTRVLRMTKKLATLESEIHNKKNLVAKATATYYIFRV